MTDIIKYPWSEYGEGFKVDEYNGEISLVAANEGQDGKVYMRWMYPQGKGKDAGPINKSIPWKIPLGRSKEEAIDNLRAAAEIIKRGVNTDPF